MVSEIVAMAKVFAGETMTYDEEETLAALSKAAFAEWSGRLRPGIVPEDCPEAFLPACAWTALAGLLTGREVAEPFLSFTAGDVSVRHGVETRQDTVSHLRGQAERLMRAYIVDDRFSFQGVRG